MFALHDNVSREDCDKVAVKSEDCEATDCYRNWAHPNAGEGYTETVSDTSGAQSQVINVKEECAMDCVSIKDERNAGNASDFVAQCAEEFHLKSEDIDDESVDDSQNYGLPEECVYPNVGKPVDETASAISWEQTQMIKVKTEESATMHISVDAGDVSDCSGAHTLKPEEVDLGCEFIEEAQSSNSDDEDSSDENSEKIQPQKLATDKSLKCPFCEIEYFDENTLRKHLLMHTGEYICVLCDMKFTQKSDFNRHVLTHPVDKPCQKAFDQKMYLNNPKLTLARVFVCDICEKQCTTNDDFTAHMKWHNKKPLACEFCGKKFRSNFQLLSHRVNHTGEKRYKCDVCGKKFGRKVGLKVHMFLHTGDKPHVCHICNRKYAMKATLVRHLLTHTSKKTYKCNYCEQELPDNPLFIEHLLMHSGGRPFKCMDCPRQFDRPGPYNKHLLRHTGKRPYGCNVCEKTFYMKALLADHLQTHTVRGKKNTCKLCGKITTYTIGDGTGTKRFICDCSLTDNGDKTHECTVCKKKYSQKYLKEHMLTHTAEKLYECTECDKKYAFKGNFTKHKLTHSKSFKCNLCEKVYSSKYGLQTHMLKHTEKESQKGD